MKPQEDELYGSGTEAGKRECKVEKEVRSIDKPSGTHFSAGKLFPTCLQLAAARRWQHRKRD